MSIKPKQIKLYRNETEFEKSFALQCEAKYGWHYIKIPDIIPQKSRAGQYYIPASKKLPFDGVLSTPMRIIAIELKYQNGQLKPHQLDNLAKIYSQNKSAYVIRYKYLQRRGNVFSVEVVEGGKLTPLYVVSEMSDLLNILYKLILAR